jgi:hypothetical protein
MQGNKSLRYSLFLVDAAARGDIPRVFAKVPHDNPRISYWPTRPLGLLFAGQGPLVTRFSLCRVGCFVAARGKIFGGRCIQGIG